MKTYTVRIELQQEDDGRWSIWAPDLPGCATWGNTQDEALANIQEAVEGYIEILLEDGLPIPPGVTISDTPTVSVTVPAA